MKDYLEQIGYALTDRWRPRKRAVYDGFIFFNELEILKLRLKELYEHVDKFVLVEANMTFQSRPKPLYFQDNKDQFQEFKDKIIHIIVEDMPNSPDPMVNEVHQRNAISRGFVGCRDYDIVLVSDVDEIPNYHAIDYYKKKHLFSIKKLDQKLYYYYLNIYTNSPWRLSYIASYFNIKGKNLNTIRKSMTKKKHKRHLLYNGGWHFSYLGGVDSIIQKLEAFSHNDYNTDKYKDRERLINCMNEGKDLFDRQDYKYELVNIDESFPRQVVDNIDYYQQIGWIK